MKKTAALWSLVVICGAQSAFAANSNPDPAADTVAPAPQPAPPVDVRVQVETGVASTRVNNGIPQYSGKAVPASESSASLSFEHLGPGTLGFSGAAFVAMADHSKQPPSSLELVLGTSYGGMVGPVDASIGYAAHFLPRAEPVDAAHQAIGKLALPNAYVTPTLDVVGEFVRERGAYTALGLQHEYRLGRLGVMPRASVGAEGHDGVDFHANDFTASVQARYDVSQAMYLSLRPAYALQLAPASMLKDASFTGRSTPFAVLSIGVHN